MKISKATVSLRMVSDSYQKLWGVHFVLYLPTWLLHTTPGVEWLPMHRSDPDLNLPPGRGLESGASIRGSITILISPSQQEMKAIHSTVSPPSIRILTDFRRHAQYSLKHLLLVLIPAGQLNPPQVTAPHP